MRRTLLPLLALAFVLGAADLRASETARDVPAAEVTPRIASPDAPAAGELRLTTVERSVRADDADAAVAQLPQRGTFWWFVGVIVVAGIILAVLL